MRIIRFYASWCYKCKIFSDRARLGYDADVSIDLPSNKKTLVKYQINIIPTFLALSDSGKILGKLSNPLTVEDYFEWKKRIESKIK